ARTSTPPRRARSGKTCPGLTMSPGVASARMAVRMVVARSTAEMPRPMPWRASIETVNAVPSGARFSLTIIGRPSWSQRRSVSDRQTSPRPWVAMKLTCSAVTRSAATQRSPSFSRSSSSMRMTMRPARISASASSVPTTYGLWRRGDIDPSDDRRGVRPRPALRAEPGAATERQSSAPMAGGRAGADPWVAEHERRQRRGRQHAAPGDRRLRACPTLAAEQQHEPGIEDARDDRHRVARMRARLELADEEERHAAERDRDRERIARMAGLAHHERREQEDPHDAAVLEEDRVGRRRPLGGDHEGREAGGAARGRREEARPAAAELRPEEQEEDGGRGRGAVGGDLEGRLGDRLDADAAERPEEGRPGDLEDAPALRRHSTVTLLARLRGW